MTDETEPFDPDEPLTESVERDKRGSLMTEFESYERVVEGLKLASDGARHMARHRPPDPWNKLAMFLDSLRKAIMQESGFNRLQDAKTSHEAWSGAPLSVTQAHSRLMDGLKGAAAGAKQISLCQRMDLKWTLYAERFELMKKQAHELALATSPLKVKSGWQNRTSGLLVPASVH